MNPLSSIKQFDVSSLPFADYLILSAAQRIGLLDQILDHRPTLKEIITVHSRHKLFIESLTMALRAHGYIFLDQNQHYRLNPSLVDILKTTQSAILYNYDWYKLILDAPQLVNQKSKPKISVDTYNRFIDISENLSRDLWPTLRERFPILATDCLKFLDLGCGKMWISRQLASINPQASIIGIDQNKYAADFLAKELTKKPFRKITFIKEDAFKSLNQLADTYDFILISHLLHWTKPEQISKLIQICYKRLKKGGYILIHEDYLSDSFLTPKSSIRKNLSLSVLGYRILSKSEILDLLKKTNFTARHCLVIKRRRVLYYATK